MKGFFALLALSVFVLGSLASPYASAADAVGVDLGLMGKSGSDTIHASLGSKFLDPAWSGASLMVWNSKSSYLCHSNYVPGTAALDPDFKGISMRVACNSRVTGVARYRSDADLRIGQAGDVAEGRYTLSIQLIENASGKVIYDRVVVLKGNLTWY